MKIRHTKRPTALVLGLAMAVMLPAQGLAAAPSPITDETAYISYDHYGAIENVDIVKAVDLNGASLITDYGLYDSVKNMTTLDEPVYEADQLLWNFHKDIFPQRFYYEVKPRGNTMELPYLIDVSYRMNGHAAVPEDMAGRSGMADICLSVRPNPKASAYMRSNFALVAAMMVNTEKGDTLSAPGSQFMTLGTYEAAMYAALPGMEDEFTFSVGSDAFESAGVFIMMVPLTMEKLSLIKELSEKKDTAETALIATNDILDELIVMLSGLSEPLNRSGDGLDHLLGAYDTGKSHAGDLGERITKIRGDLRRMNTSLEELAAVNADHRLKTDIDLLCSDLSDAVDAIENLVYGLDKASATMENISDTLGENYDDFEGTLDGTLINDVNQLSKETEELSTSAYNLLTAYPELFGSLSTLAKTLGDSSDSADAWEQIAISTGSAVTDEVETLTRELSRLITDAEDMSDGLSSTVDSLDHMGDDIDDILYKLSITLTELSATLTSTDELMDSSESLIMDIRADLDTGVTMSLSGLSSLVKGLARSLSGMDDIKKNKDIITDLISEEWQKLSSNTALLALDVDAPMQSFTSSKNDAPRTVQIVARTKEIAVVSAPAPAEAETPQTTSLPGRIYALFGRIAAFFAGLFGRNGNNNE